MFLFLPQMHGFLNSVQNEHPPCHTELVEVSRTRQLMPLGFFATDTQILVVLDYAPLLELTKEESLIDSSFYCVPFRMTTNGYCLFATDVRISQLCSK